MAVSGPARARDHDYLIKLLLIGDSGNFSSISCSFFFRLRASIFIRSYPQLLFSFFLNSFFFFGDHSVSQEDRWYLLRYFQHTLLTCPLSPCVFSYIFYSAQKNISLFFSVRVSTYFIFCRKKEELLIFSFIFLWRNTTFSYEDAVCVFSKVMSSHLSFFLPIWIDHCRKK